MRWEEKEKELTLEIVAERVAWYPEQEADNVERPAEERQEMARRRKRRKGRQAGTRKSGAVSCGGPASLQRTRGRSRRATSREA